MPVVAFALVALLLFIRMKDLGAAGLFMGLFLAMFYLASGDRKLVGLGAGVFLVGAVAASFALPHVQNRLNAFWAPWVHYDGPGYQVAQALMSLGNGGLVGTGLGAGLGGIWLGANSLVPNALTDMPFVIICEELGAIAGLAVLVLFAALVARLFYGALTLRAAFGKLVAAGIASLVALHVVLIVGGVLKVLPLTGITTPFISYGGSSLLTNFALVEAIPGPYPGGGALCTRSLNASTSACAACFRFQSSPYCCSRLPLFYWVGARQSYLNQKSATYRSAFLEDWSARGSLISADDQCWPNRSKIPRQARLSVAILWARRRRRQLVISPTSMASRDWRKAVTSGFPARGVRRQACSSSFSGCQACPCLATRCRLLSMPITEDSLRSPRGKARSGSGNQSADRSDSGACQFAFLRCQQSGCAL